MSTPIPDTSDRKHVGGLLALCPFIVAAVLLSFPWSASAEPVEVKVSPDGIQRAEIVLKSYSYQPDHLIVKANVPVELTLRNAAWIIPHNFVIQAKEAGLEVSEEVPAGKTIKVTFTPEQPGEYRFICNKKLLFFKSHEAKGMVGILEVIEE